MAAPALRLSVAYGVLHALVDLACVTAAVRSSRLVEPGLLTTFTVVVGYDLLAFALQAPLGVLVDRFRASHAALRAGLVLSAVSVLVIPLPSAVPMVVAGLGNALFHVGAGAQVLAVSGGRAAPAGIFVGPGALGLGLGTWLGRSSTAAVWPLVLPLLLGMLLVSRDPGPAASVPAAHHAPRSLALTILAALLVSTTVRAFVGSGAAYLCAPSVWLLAGLSTAAFAGKALGGVLADRLGWMETSVGALVLAAPLLAFNGGSPVLVVLGVLLFQSTMPVTLVSVHAVLPGKPATAFGLACLALILGAVPSFYPLGKAFFGANTFVALVVTSVVALYGALDLLGVRRRFTGYGPPNTHQLSSPTP